MTFSSPSEKVAPLSPAEGPEERDFAITRYPIGPFAEKPSGMARSKLTDSPEFGAMRCSFTPPCAPAAAPSPPAPKPGRGASVAGSKNSSVTATFIASSVILLTRAVRPISSPSRTKRGTLGSTISSFCVVIIRSETALARFLSWVKSLNRQLVSASGLSKLMTRLPSWSLVRSGSQKAVSCRFLRICTGASALSPGAGGGGGGGAATPAGLLCTITSSTAESSNAAVVGTGAEPYATAPSSASLESALLLKTCDLIRVTTNGSRSSVGSGGTISIFGVRLLLRPLALLIWSVRTCMFSLRS